MHSNNFEKAFDDFINRREYDETQNALFSMIRVSFEAGWKAAGGEPPTPHRIFNIIRSEASEPNGDTEPEK